MRIRNFSITAGKSEKGGGIFIDSSKVFLTNVNIENNLSEGQGGGLYISSSEVVLRDVKVDKNHADGDGGGLYIYCNSDVDFDNSIVSSVLWSTMIRVWSTPVSSIISNVRLVPSNLLICGV